ncbi:MAG: type II toxin-antitoxin system MqsA family antitoxin [Myxococcales bacterium]|nr:type II toxin-antitoxin system MqsA family antitoxin [Myxococcales bacterium]
MTPTPCALCKRGQLAPGSATVTVSRGEGTVIIKGVPADVCDNCGEYYLAGDIAKRVYSVADAALLSGCEVEIRRFAA